MGIGTIRLNFLLALVGVSNLALQGRDHLLARLLVDRDLVLGLGELLVDLDDVVDLRDGVLVPVDDQ